MFKEIDYNKHFVIGTPLVGWKCDRNEDMTWLQNRIDIMNKFNNATFFAALELDHRGLEPFAKVIDALNEVHGKYWTYTINDYEEQVTSANRWIRIETGRNLVREFAQRRRVMSGHHWGEQTPQDGVVNYDAVLYVDSDTTLTAEIIEKMFEVDRPLVGVDVPAYALRGKEISKNPRIEEHWTTAGMLLVNSPAYYDLPWYHNAYLNLSDDPTFQSLAERLPERDAQGTLFDTYGMTWVRKDIKSDHKGELVGVEERNIPKRVID
jgi:hypothetical protein